MTFAITIHPNKIYPTQSVGFGISPQETTQHEIYLYLSTTPHNYGIPRLFSCRD